MNFVAMLEVDAWGSEDSGFDRALTTLRDLNNLKLSSGSSSTDVVFLILIFFGSGSLESSFLLKISSTKLLCFSLKM